MFDAEPLSFFHTHVSPQAIELVTRVLRSGWLSEGQMVKTFEATLADRLGLLNPVAVNSGTAALHLALAVAGVGPGDEVILPPQTFVATGLAVLMQSAIPVFADIDPCTGNLALPAVRAKISARTKAIMPVHWAGYPCELQEINALAEEHGLAVVEDAAHALGATYHGQPVGSISRFTAFSFQAIKHLTTGDGGALCCLEAGDTQLALARRWFGIDRAASQPSLLGERIYDLPAVGYKYHMNDVAAALGLGNLEDLPERLARRQQIGALYREALGDVPGVALLRVDNDRTHAYWLFTLRVEHRTDFVRSLAAKGIPTSVVHQGIDRYSLFGGRADDLPGQDCFDREQVSLPIHEGLTLGTVDRIIAAIRAGW